MLDFEIPEREVVTVADEQSASIATLTTLTHMLAHTPVVPGSIHVNVGTTDTDTGGGVDNATAGTLGTGNTGITGGSIDYFSGKLIVNVSPAAASGTFVWVDYKYYVIPDGTDDYVEVGNPPLSLMYRNESKDDADILVGQSDESRTDWAKVFSGEVKAYAVPNIGRVATNFIRVLSDKRGRILGGSLTNL